MTDLLEMLSEETRKELETCAEVALSHMHYMEEMEETEPEALTNDDYGLMVLEQNFLIVYSLLTMGDVPAEYKKRLDG